MITAKEITNSLYWSLRSSSDLIIPRYTPRDWFECDVWRLTKSGYVDEFEIKTSLSDFKADADKSKRGRIIWNKETRGWDETPGSNKHALLCDGDKGPNRFWFVVPEKMESVDVPPWAGLMIACSKYHTYVAKPAPKRHAKKWAGNRAKLLEAYYYRYWNHEAKRTDGEIVPILDVDPEPEFSI